MSVAKFNTDALEQCRTMASGQASQFGGLGDGFAQHHGNPAIFGKLTSSAGISAAVDSLCAAVRTEFAAAESVLGKVERAVDAITQSTADVEQANAGSFKSV
ncbi:hypothetical protein F0L68_20450 [Solihabitans fulvus]|uniref:Excreted virulence factor EspC, type VII ESX diderm n=1 Tax=Solihabitans fulvus TaxID=1892852 RepID=A0A5B2XAF6_9PSEU|nr:hypothetical protein [Solihabitans fulvus]KAA2260100.1 hypothetical protein F0L68_20450 [Solihabitans fulvus]